MIAQIKCWACEHEWTKNTKAYESTFGEQTWVMANRTVQRCPNCKRTDRLSLTGEIKMGGYVKELPTIPKDLPVGTPPPSPPSTGIIRGIDVSHHNGIVDWKAKRSAGNVFCSIKATEGTGNIDPMFARNWAESTVAGFINSGYHFYHPALDAKAQAQHFISIMGKELKGHLPPLFDFEVFDGLSGKVTAEHARICVQEIQDACGVSPFIYGSPGFIEGLGDMSWAAGLSLWVAHYGVAHPRIPKPWTTYAFWQFSDANGWDLDVFNGSEAGLQKFVIK